MYVYNPEAGTALFADPEKSKKQFMLQHTTTTTH